MFSVIGPFLVEVILELNLLGHLTLGSYNFKLYRTLNHCGVIIIHRNRTLDI